jgi:two-component system, chemotaxis family, CheB/CheR fusion protein
MTNKSTDQLPEAPLPPEGEADFDEQDEGPLFPIVGVGASAGGLEAFTQLLKALPADTGMAFVLVQHLAPMHASALAEILSRSTKMPVLEVHDEPTVEPNHVYVIPPARSMIVARGALQLLPREGRGVHRPIDRFFRALAEDRRHQAIGVVLSGTATDGTLGLEAIKAEGGITFAQDVTAQHEGMPHSAIASGCVDFVLPPNEIAREIIRIGQHPYAAPPPGSREQDHEPNLAQVVKLLQRATGVDFTHYKFNTLYRRISRRMVLQKLDGMSQYLAFLRQTPAEVEALYQDILISVTSFFRDPASFDALKSQVFPRLLKDRSAHDPVRVWTLGCSTGQEAYSIAMAFKECAEATGSQVALQLFATDLNAGSIEKARAGFYAKDIAQDMAPERLRQFFTEVEGGYRIRKGIRDACVFSRHNVLADPPFSRIDLISCRNLLIYLEPVLQQKIVATLHYALKPTGYLWLGGSETIGSFRNLFDVQDAKHKIYAKNHTSGPGPALFPLQHGGMPRASFVPVTARPSDAADLPREADRVLLTKFAPPGVLVSADLDILQYRGDTGPYLAPAPGKASLSLLKMLREGLLVAVRAAILRAGKEQTTVREEGLRVKSNGGYLEVAIEVIPLKGRGLKEGGFLVLFEDSQASRERQRAKRLHSLTFPACRIPTGCA